jgi:glycerophosphoryl diester phosphodiesterase
VGYPYDGVDLRERPEEYRIGRGEQGVFHAEPYKSELLPLWGFKDVETAERAAVGVYERYLDYRGAGDFVGMDVARKFLQMGYTRARRYAKHIGGNKSRPREEEDAEKARAAGLFREKWDEVAGDPEYQRLKELHLDRYERY